MSWYVWIETSINRKKDPEPWEFQPKDKFGVRMSTCPLPRNIGDACHVQKDVDRKAASCLSPTNDFVECRGKDGISDGFQSYGHGFETAL